MEKVYVKLDSYNVLLNNYIDGKLSNKYNKHYFENEEDNITLVFYYIRLFYLKYVDYINDEVDKNNYYKTKDFQDELGLIKLIYDKWHWYRLKLGKKPWIKFLNKHLDDELLNAFSFAEAWIYNTKKGE